MSEESNKREAELSEQALSGVGGGQTYEDLIKYTRDFCNGCPNRRICNVSVEEMAAYLKTKHTRLFRYTDCPFWNRRS